MVVGASYAKVVDQGFDIAVSGQSRVLDVYHVILCASQTPKRDLADALDAAGAKAKGINVHLIGGADVAAELDAKRAIDQGSRLAAEI